MFRHLEIQARMTNKNFDKSSVRYWNILILIWKFWKLQFEGFIFETKRIGEFDEGIWKFRILN